MRLLLAPYIGAWMRCLLLGLALTLSACGGGGGEDSPVINFDKQSLTFDVREGTPYYDVEQIIKASLSGSADGPVYVGVEVLGEGLFTPIELIFSTDTQATLRITPLTGIAPGTYSGTIIFLACRDALCNQHYPGSPFQIPYTLKLRPALKVSPTTLSLAAREGQMGAASILNVQLPENVAQATVQTEYGEEYGQWLQVVNNGNTLELTPNAAGLASGDYHATLQLSNADTGETATASITLTVSDGIAVPAAVSKTITTLTAPSERQGTITVDTGLGVAAPAWTAVSNKGWLKLTTAAGNTGQNLAWELDPALFGALHNGTHEARVTVSSDTSQTPRQITFTVVRQLAEVKQVDVLALVAGTAGQVLVYGDQFDSVANPESYLQISGGVAATEVTRLGSQLLQVSLPSLAAGTYDISMRNGAGISERKARLQVLEPQTYSYQAISSIGTKVAMIWNPVNRSLLATNTGASSIVRLSHNGSSFDSQERIISEAQAYMAIGMNRNHSSVALAYKSSYQPITLDVISVDDLTTQQTLPAAPQMVYKPLLLITGDNVLWNSDISGDANRTKTIDLDTGVNRTVDTNGYPEWQLNDDASGGVSGDGRRMAFVSYSQNMVSYDVASGQFTNHGGPYSSNFVSTDYHGSRWVFGTLRLFVYDASFALLGKIDLPTGWSRAEKGGAVLSPDGRFVYVYAVKDSAISGYSETPAPTELPRVFVFDVSTAVGPENAFPVTSEIPVNDYVSCTALNGWRFGLENCTALNASITVSRDGRTLFLGGDRRFVVLPIPSEARSTAARAGKAGPRSTMRVLPGSVRRNRTLH